MIGFGNQNVFRELQDLVSPAPAFVATVSSNNGDGTATVSLRGGGQQRVRSSSILGVGDQVLVQEGEVLGKAPSLAFQSVSLG